ncbi:MAG: peroxiredoxin family protein, partial [Planctomycetaceae bacterium]
APLIASSEGNLFVGQGDEHKLTMQLEQLETLDAEAVEKQLGAWAKLEKLQQELARKPGEFRPELGEEQLAQVAAALPELKKLAEDTPLSALVTAISADLRGQSDRSTEVTRLQSKFVGKPAPEFELTLLDRKTVKAEDLKDQVVVLHFWEYQAEPLVEPYGQIGFLDFLNDRRKKLGVKVFGVAVDERFGNAEGAAAAGKSVQRLKSFMNLGYPLAGDDGKLLKRFGDPRELNSQLPLWIVIGADGKIAHYHSGLYKIDSDEGLKELDEELIRQIRLARGKPAD